MGEWENSSFPKAIYQIELFPSFGIRDQSHLTVQLLLNFLEQFIPLFRLLDLLNYLMNDFFSFFLCQGIVINVPWSIKRYFSLRRYRKSMPLALTFESRSLTRRCWWSALVFPLCIDMYQNYQGHRIFRSHQESVYRTCEEFVIESPVLVLVFAQLFEDIVSGNCIHVFGQEVAPKLFERDVLLLSTDVLKRFAQLFFFWFSMLFLNHETS